MLQSVWRIRLLGGFQVDQGPHTLPRFSTSQTALLFAVIADQVGRSIRREELIELLWQGVEKDNGRNRLRVALAYLRRILEPPGTPSNSILKCDRSDVTLASAASEVDSGSFSTWIEKARCAQDREEVIRSYVAADQLYKGKFLAGWSGDWVQERQLHYARIQAQAQSRLSKLYEEIGDSEGALRSAFRASAADPLREVLVRRTINLQLDGQDVAGALEEYERYRALLKAEVGLIPTYELRALAKRLKVETALQRANLGASLSSSASQSLAEPEVFVQDRSAGAVSLIPPTLTSFHGRSVELAEVSELLLVHRWLTITGPGGIGKSRLAIEVARRNQSNFARGTFVISSPDEANPTTLLENLLVQLSLDPSPEPFEALRDFLQDRTSTGRDALLFVFDGFDHYPQVTMEILNRLLFELPNATILVTSGFRVGATGEVEYFLGPLTLPGQREEIEALSRNESVALFVDRVKAFSPRFALTKTNVGDVTALCRRLDGVPLAIELAAAQAADGAVHQVLGDAQNLSALWDRKNWRPLRHRSFVANLEASFGKLSDHEQRIFSKLCVFRGSIEPTAASIVAGASSEDLERLADRSFLGKKPANHELRYTILELVREFGWSQLPAEAQSDLLERHAGFFRQLVRDIETLNVNGGIQQRIRVTSDSENLRLATSTTLASKDGEAMSGLAMCLAWHWIYEGNQLEGLALIRRAREKCLASELSETQFEFAEGIVASFHDDFEVGQRCLSSSIPKLAAAGMKRVATVGRVALSYAMYVKGDFEGHYQLCSASQRDFREQGMARWDAYECHLLACVLCQMGRYEDATHWHGEAERIWREMGDLAFEGYPSLGLARIALYQQQLELAKILYAKASRLLRKWKDVRGVCYALDGLARTAAHMGDYRRAALLFGAVESSRSAMGLVRDFADQRDFDLALNLIQSAPAESIEAAWAEGRKLSQSEAADWALMGIDAG